MNRLEPGKGLLEETLIKRLLHGFLDKLDKPRSRLSIKISPKQTPELFIFENDVNYLWTLIQSLEKDYQIIHIKLSIHHSRDKEVYEDATITFNRDKALLVRQWLNRPFELTHVERWQNALEECKDLFTVEQIKILSDSIIKHPTKTEKEILLALHQIEQALNDAPVALSCRALAASYFNGDSKFLDQRESLLRRLFASLSYKIKSRPILLSVAIPENTKSTLFIENQESFLACVEHHSHPMLSQTALIYSAGYRGAAERIRDKYGVVFTHIHEVSTTSKLVFEQWWYEGKHEWPCYFWGDLDYDGMRILANLRHNFTHLQAWQPGYDVMLDYHQKGVCHAPTTAKKEQQKKITATGCRYADQHLLPLLLECQLFLDQEVVDVGDLCESHISY